MVSKTAPDPAWTGRRIDFPTFCAELSARRAAAGDPPVPRNAGKNRTASKRALLKAIEDAGGKWRSFDKLRMSGFRGIRRPVPDPGRLAAWLNHVP